MEITTIILIILAAIIVWVIMTYNRFIKLVNLVKESWSGIDVQLKRRFNLIPNLIETVKGYAKHEQETLNKVIAARNSAINAEGVAAQNKAETQLQSALANVFALSEAYPDLKANTNFLQLQKEMSDIEGDVEKARRYYNATVRENNLVVESFPSNLFANMFGFHLGEYFEIEDAGQREMPQVKF